MVVSMPRKGLVNTDPPDMVRVQLKENDIRSYRRKDAEELLASGTHPGAFIVGEQPDEDGEEAEQPEPARVRSQRTAPNKARSTRAAPASPAAAPPVETKGAEPPSPGSSDPAASETKPE